MIDQNKIVLMSKLALEEKKFTKKDRKITEYYLEDYIYISNLKTRLIVLVIVGIMMMAQILYKVEEGLNIPTTIREWVLQYIIPYGSVMLIALVVYTFFSSIVYTKQYNSAEKRKKKYQKALKELEEYEENTKGGSYDSR